MIFLSVFGVKSYITYINQEETYKIYLSEIEPGIYAIREEIVSRVPSENYTLAMVCTENGQFKTIKGDCNVVFNNEETPYAVITNRHIVNSDVVTLYIPNGSVKVNIATAVR